MSDRDSDSTMMEFVRDRGRRRYGKYRGFVEDNEDPDKRGRLKLRVRQVYGDEPSDWALPCLPFGGATSHGLFFLPEKDDVVWVEFEEGDVDRPIWTGFSCPPETEVPDFGRRTLKTPKGHLIELVDVDDEEAVIITHQNGTTKIELDVNGSIQLIDATEAKLMLDAENEEIILTDKHENLIKTNSDGVLIEDANGNKIEMSSSGLLIEDANGNKIEMASAGVTIEGSAVDVK